MDKGRAIFSRSTLDKIKQDAIILRRVVYFIDRLITISKQYRSWWELRCALNIVALTLKFQTGNVTFL